MSRIGHPTLKPVPSSLGIVDLCFRDLKCPTEQEVHAYAQIQMYVHMCTHTHAHTCMHTTHVWALVGFRNLWCLLFKRALNFHVSFEKEPWIIMFLLENAWAHLCTPISAHTLFEEETKELGFFFKRDFCKTHKLTRATHKCTHTQHKCWELSKMQKHTRHYCQAYAHMYTHTYTHTYMYAHTYTHMYTHVRTHTYTHTHTHTHTYTCTHTHTHTHTQNNVPTFIFSFKNSL